MLQFGHVRKSTELHASGCRPSGCHAHASWACASTATEGMPTKRGHGTRALFRSVFAAAVLLFLLFTASAQAAGDDDDDELPDYRPGLVATYEAPASKPIVRRDDDVQFVWRAGSPDARIAAGPFKAR